MKRFGYQVIGLEKLRKLLRAERQQKVDAVELNFLRYPRKRNVEKVVNALPVSKAQLRQDIFALECVNFKKGGFFVEFGATDGVNLSNTYLLEKSFEWSGILAEPGRNWHNTLRENRSCAIETRCVWSESGQEIVFSESSRPEYSGVSGQKDVTSLRYQEDVVETYRVPTVSLLDLLEEHEAPEIIDFLSVDTEGSELRILEAFDFNAYSFRVITVEHNFSSHREQIFKLLTTNGYSRVREELSIFDDWYIKRELCDET